MAPASLCQDPGAYVSVVCVLLFRFVSFSWRMIAFQCPAGFCPSSAWISHRPSWRSSRPPRSGLSPRPGRAPRLTRCTPSRAVSPRRRTCLCCSPHASPPPSQRPQVCSLRLHCCPANRLIACSRCVCDIHAAQPPGNWLRRMQVYSWKPAGPGPRPGSIDGSDAGAEMQQPQTFERERHV